MNMEREREPQTQCTIVPPSPLFLLNKQSHRIYDKMLIIETFEEGSNPTIDIF